ncbi:MAG: hypothetical protein LRY76_07530 [Alphaproteobacteria bacterium]|nr:hypothetical protein [Alphaproteobacteria bacterium]
MTLKKTLLLVSCAILGLGALPVISIYSAPVAHATTPPQFNEEAEYNKILQLISNISDPVAKQMATTRLNQIRGKNKPADWKIKYYDRLEEIVKKDVSTDEMKAWLTSFPHAPTGDFDDSDDGSDTSDGDQPATAAEKKAAYEEIKATYFDDDSCKAPSNFDKLSGVKKINADNKLSIDEYTTKMTAFVEAYTDKKCVAPTDDEDCEAKATAAQQLACENKKKLEELKKACSQMGGKFNSSTQSCESQTAQNNCNGQNGYNNNGNYGNNGNQNCDNQQNQQKGGGGGGGGGRQKVGLDGASGGGAGSQTTTPGDAIYGSQGKPGGNTNYGGDSSPDNPGGGGGGAGATGGDGQDNQNAGSGGDGVYVAWADLAGLGDSGYFSGGGGGGAGAFGVPPMHMVLISLMIRCYKGHSLALVQRHP